MFFFEPDFMLSSVDYFYYPKFMIFYDLIFLDFIFIPSDFSLS
jgi:hypothetical protein